LCSVLFCFVLFCFVLFCFVLFCFVLFSLVCLFPSLLCALYFVLAHAFSFLFHFSFSACDADDYVIQYGPCLANGTRLQQKTLVSPISCLGAVVMGGDLVPCDDCPPGTWRVGAECKGCSSGQSPSSDGVHTCTSCPGGSYATPVKYFQNFDTHSFGEFTKYCSGDCGSNWRLVGEDLDSGINHGSSVFLSLQPPPTSILSGGLVNITYDLICEGRASCSLSVILVPIFSGSSMEDLYSSVSFHDFKPGFNKFTSIGTESSKTELYSLYFAFEKSSTNESRTRDRVVIHVSICFSSKWKIFFPSLC
jgi:hypothetical protein